MQDGIIFGKSLLNSYHRLFQVLKTQVDCRIAFLKNCEIQYDS
jgi:hypothetical protein